MKRLALLAALLAGGCGGGGSSGADGSLGDSSATLSGKIGGKPWTLVAAETNAFLSSSDGYWADLYELPLDASCFHIAPTGSQYQMILTVPMTVGDHALGLNLTQTFVIDDGSDPNGPKNLVATNGHIDVTELTATTIRGNAQITYDAANTVAGSFAITICP